MGNWSTRCRCRGYGGDKGLKLGCGALAFVAEFGKLGAEPSAERSGCDVGAWASSQSGCPRPLEGSSVRVAES
jgi:hypothetical protein